MVPPQLEYFLPLALGLSLLRLDSMTAHWRVRLPGRLWHRLIQAGVLASLGMGLLNVASLVISRLPPS